MLTTEQQTTLANAIKAETTAEVIAALAIRNDVFLAQWCNQASTTDAWNSEMTATDLFQAMDVAKFDNLTAGKRDAWRLMLDFAPINCTRNTNRKAILDIWGATDSVSVLNSCIRKATKAEKYIGGNSATTNTVTALKLNWVGIIEITELSKALNANP